MDPLAGLDNANQGPLLTDEKDVVDINTLRYNLMHIDTTRSVMNITSGCVAGICGFTGWQGLGKRLSLSMLLLFLFLLLLLLLLGSESESESANLFGRCCYYQDFALSPSIIVVVFIPLLSLSPFCQNHQCCASLLFGPPPHRHDDNLGHKAELPTKVLYAAIDMVVCHGKCATKRAFVHAVLDSFLRACVFVLRFSLWKMKKDSRILLPQTISTCAQMSPFHHILVPSRVVHAFDCIQYSRTMALKCGTTKA